MRYLTSLFLLLTLLGVHAAQPTANVPISQMSIANTLQTNAWIPIIQPLPGRTTNDNFRVSPAAFTAYMSTNAAATNIFNTLIVTNLTVITNITLNGTNVAALNPTIGRYPYNLDGTNFGDGSLRYVDPTTSATPSLEVDDLQTGGVVVSMPITGIVTNAPNASGVLTNDGSGNIGWATISSGTTINATDNYLPARFNATTFTNSPFYLDGFGGVAVDSYVEWRNGADYLDIQQSGGSSKIYGSSLIELNAPSMVQFTSPSAVFTWSNTNSPLIRLIGFTDGINGAADFTLQHTGTNGAVVFSSLSSGTAGAPRPFMFTNAPVILAPITKVEKTALTPAEGMIVFQSDNTPGLRVYQSGAWRMVSTVADP